RLWPCPGARKLPDGRAPRTRKRAPGHWLDHRGGDTRAPGRAQEEARLARRRRRGARRTLCPAPRRRIRTARHGGLRGQEMNEHRPVKRQPSLLERAADLFGIDPAAGAPTIDVSGLPPEPAKSAKARKEVAPALHEAGPAAATDLAAEVAPAPEAAPAIKASLAK